MRLLFAFILTVVLSVTDTASAEDARRAQVAAATADALDTLQRDVLSAPVTPELSVEQFVEKTGSREAFAKSLRRAEQIGGTRWLPDDQTCQIRLELHGSDVADTIVQIAQAKPGAIDVPVDVLEKRVERLRDMTFAATGVSTGAIDRLRPPADRGAWRGVPEAALRAAVDEARRSAAGQVLQSVEGIAIPGERDTRVAKLLADQKVHDALQGWLMNRPVTSVDFKPDLEVRVGVAADGEAFWEQLTAAVGDRKDLPLPSDEKLRAELRDQILRHVEPAVGRATAKAGGGPAPQAAQALEIPRDPPQWVFRPVDARGVARPVDGRLKTARAAESAGRDRLRAQIESLQLSRKLTLGEAARRDSRVRDAIDRAVEGARYRKVNYLADGSAEVTFTLDLRDLWSDLEAP